MKTINTGHFPHQRPFIPHPPNPQGEGVGDGMPTTFIGVPRYELISHERNTGSGHGCGHNNHPGQADGYGRGVGEPYVHNYAGR